MTHHEMPGQRPGAWLANVILTTGARLSVDKADERVLAEVLFSPTTGGDIFARGPNRALWLSADTQAHDPP
jgi:hypothetical protein